MIWRPKLFLTIWGVLVVVLAGLTLAIGDDGDSGYFVADPKSIPLPTVAPNARESVLSALQSNAGVSEVLAQAGFEISEPRVEIRQGVAVGLWFDIEMETLISHTGPWLFLSCRGTVQTEETILWTNVKLIRAIVSDDGEVLAFAPFPSFDGEGSMVAPVTAPSIDAPYTTTVRSLPEARILFSAESLSPGYAAGKATALTCPKGMNDD